MNSKKHQELECRKAVLLKYAVHWFRGSYEVTLLQLAAASITY